MKNSIRHSIDIKSEDFVVIIALQNLQTFIMIGYTAVDNVNLNFDFSYLWALCVGTLLFIYSLISFVVIRTFVFSKIDIGKYILELLFIASIIANCSLSIIIDSFKIANMQLLFFSFALTGYAYYNLITLIFCSVSLGIIIQYNLNAEQFSSNMDSLYIIDFLSYILQIIGGNILYFRMYELCYLIVLSKKNPCKYVVASKEVKNLEKHIFTSLLNSYMCFKSKTYSNLAHTTDLYNKDNSILDNDMKANSIFSQEKSITYKNFPCESDNNNSNENNHNKNTNSYFKKLKNSNTISHIHNSNYSAKSLSSIKKISNKKLHNRDNTKKEVITKRSIGLDNLKNQNNLEQNSTKLRKSKKAKMKHNADTVYEKPKKKKKVKKSGIIISSKKSLFLIEDTHKEEIYSDENYDDSKSHQRNNKDLESILTTKNSSMDENIKKDNILLQKSKKSYDVIINISSNQIDCNYKKNNKDRSYKCNKSRKHQQEIYQSDNDYSCYSNMYYITKNNQELNKNETIENSEENAYYLNKVPYDENKENIDLSKSKEKREIEHSKSKCKYTKYDNFFNFFRKDKIKIHNNDLKKKKLVNNNEFSRLKIKKKKKTGMEETYEDIYEYNELKYSNNLKENDYNINFKNTERKYESTLEDNKNNKEIQNENIKEKKSTDEKKNSIELYKYDKNYNNNYSNEKNSNDDQIKYNKYRSNELITDEGIMNETQDILKLENKLMYKNLFLTEGSEINENNDDIIIKYEKKTLNKNVLFRKSKSSLYKSNDSENNSNNCTLSNNNRSKIFATNYSHKISNKETKSPSNSNYNYRYDKKSVSNQQHEIMDKIIELDISSQIKKNKKKNKKKKLSLSKKKIYFISNKGKRYNLFFFDNPKLKILFMSLPRCFKNIYDLSKRIFVDLKKKKILMQNATWKNKSFIPERDPLGLFKNTKLENWYITWMDEFNKNIISKTYYIYVYLIIYIIALDFLTSYKLYCAKIENVLLDHQNYLNYTLLKTMVNIILYIFFLSLFKNKKKNDYDIRKYYVSTLLLCIVKLIVCLIDIYEAVSSLDYFKSPYFVYVYIHMLIIQTSILLIVRYPTQYLLFFIYVICLSSIYWTFSIYKSFMEFIFIIACVLFTIIYSYILCSRALEINRRILFSKYELPYLLYLKEIVYCLNKNQNKGYM